MMKPTLRIMLPQVMWLVFDLYLDD